jgi:hypothetical protein
MIETYEWSWIKRPKDLRGPGVESQDDGTQILRSPTARMTPPAFMNRSTSTSRLSLSDV